MAVGHNHKIEPEPLRDGDPPQGGTGVVTPGTPGDELWARMEEVEDHVDILRKAIPMPHADLEERLQAIERAITRLVGGEPDDPTNAVYFGGDLFPVQRLVLTSEKPDVGGGHMLVLRHEARDVDGEWHIIPVDNPHYSIGTEGVRVVDEREVTS